MNREFDYYRVHTTSDSAVPLIDTDDDCPRYLSKKGPVENPQLLLFCLAEPIPRKPKMADYHSSPDSVISKKLFDVLSPLKIDGIQLLPARIKGLKDELFFDYWAIHIYNSIECIDRSLSKCEVDSFMISDVEKIILDKEKLKAIPLENRLIFRLKEDQSYQLFHASIVDAINNTNPEGVRFTNIEDWHDGSFFS